MYKRRFFPVQMLALLLALAIGPAEVNADIVEAPVVDLEIETCPDDVEGPDTCAKSCPAADDTIAILYEDTNYGGSCLKISGGSCVGSIWYRTTMPDNWYSKTWDNRVSSGGVSFVGEGAGCGSITFWQFENFEGRTATCSRTCTDLFDDDMDNRASSFVICSGARECPIPSNALELDV